MIQYEYRVVPLTDSIPFAIQQMLNERGQEGWELINVTGGPTIYYYFFKRQIVTLNS